MVMQVAVGPDYLPRFWVAISDADILRREGGRNLLE